jgi:hypothetical protein
MFAKQTFFERLKLWKEFRETIETSKTPLEDVLNFWRMAPLGRQYTDPYDSALWPDPWELIEENIYCEFLQILGVCYTLQLTERFSQSKFEIHITLNKKENAIVYLLFVDNQPIGYYNDESIDISKLRNFVSQMHHTVEPYG